MPAQEVEDITAWLDYDSIETEFENGFEGDLHIEEAVPVQADIRRQVGRTRPRPVRLTQPPARHAVPLPSLDPSYMDCVPMRTMLLREI